MGFLKVSLFYWPIHLHTLYLYFQCVWMGVLKCRTKPIRSCLNEKKKSLPEAPNICLRLHLIGGDFESLWGAWHADSMNMHAHVGPHGHLCVCMPPSVGTRILLRLLWRDSPIQPTWAYQATHWHWQCFWAPLSRNLFGRHERGHKIPRLIGNKVVNTRFFPERPSCSENKNKIYLSFDGPNC